MSGKPIASMTDDELVAIIRTAVRLELSDIGLRLDTPEDRDAAREDLRLIRKFRNSYNGASARLGGAIILALVSGLLWLLWVGFQAIAGKVP